MTLEATPLSPAIGALVRGVDLAQPLDPATQETLRRVFYDHVILLIRDQQLDADGLLRAGGFLGTVGKRGRPTTVQREDNPYITKVSNIRENGRLIGSLPDGEMLFHADACFFEMPHRASFLYAVEVPSLGGNTLFANMYRAYELVPAALRKRLAERTVLQEYDYTTYEKTDRAAGLVNVRRHSHPIFITHPVTQRRALFVNRLMTKQIEGLPQTESDAILAELFGYAEDPSIVYEHVWRPGDFLAWDNLSSTHARTDFSSAERRLLLRGTIAGDYRPQP